MEHLTGFRQSYRPPGAVTGIACPQSMTGFRETSPGDDADDGAAGSGGRLVGTVRQVEPFGMSVEFEETAAPGGVVHRLARHPGLADRSTRAIRNPQSAQCLIGYLLVMRSTCT